MSKSPWKQEGPLGNEGDQWGVDVRPAGSHLIGQPYARIDLSEQSAAIVTRDYAQHLRDFARSLNQAADDLEKG